MGPKYDNAKDVEGVLHKFCKYVLNLPCNVCNPAVRGELGQCTMKSRRYVRIVKFWIRILQMNSDRYVAHCINFNFISRNKTKNAGHIILNAFFFPMVSETSGWRKDLAMKARSFLCLTRDVRISIFSTGKLKLTIIQNLVNTNYSKLP